MKCLSLVIIIYVLCISCNNEISKDKLFERIKSEINIEFKKRANETVTNYTINSLSLIHIEDKQYSGILKTTEEGKEFTYVVEVIVDVYSYMWKIVQ